VGPTELAYRERLVSRFRLLQARGEKITSHALVGHNLPGRYTKLKHLLERGADFVVEPSGRGPAVYFLRPLSPAAERWVIDHTDAVRRYGAVELCARKIEQIVRDVKSAGLSCELDEGGRQWKGRLIRL
jgi:hypothetical protein